MGKDEAVSTASVSVAIIGTGFAGLSAAYYLKRAGIDSVLLFEKSDAIGGVWRDNSYPGAACDIPSHLYSYSFERRYPWRSRFAKQPEILAYIRHVAAKHRLESQVRYRKELAHGEFDEARGVWRLLFTDGSRFEAQVLVSAVGQLHRPACPRIDGIERFGGRVFHSAQWDHGYDFHGKTVAVIGTGASAVQFVPEIARQVRQLHVFQRSPGWCIPKFEHEFNRFERWLLQRLPAVYDIDRLRIFAIVEFLGKAMTERTLTARLADAVLRTGAALLMRAQVRDPVLRRKLTPDFPVGCKRTLLSNDWLRALARSNVEVVTDAVAAAAETGVRTVDGRLREVDAIIYGTGFAASDFLAPVELQGLGGASLRERWRDGAEAYKGVSVAGFPNLVMMYGPNTNLGGGSIIYMLEQQSRYLVEYVKLLRRANLRYADVRDDAQRRYNEQLAQRSAGSSFEAGCHSWYLNAAGRNVNNWVGSMSEYRRKLRDFDARDYLCMPAPRRPVVTVDASLRA